MQSLVFRWLFVTLVILASSYLLPGLIVESFGAALAAAAVLGILNALLKPVLILLTLPLTILSLGFFLLIINALLFQMVGYFVSGFQVNSFFSAFVASLFVSFFSWLSNLSVKKIDGEQRIIITGERKTRVINPQNGD